MGCAWTCCGPVGPSRTLPPNPFVSNLTFPAQDTFVNWKDLSPRVGGAYDLFGTGRTALKGSVARYVEATSDGVERPGQPDECAGGDDESQLDRPNGDFTVFNPDFTLQTAEFGPSSNANFGRSVRTRQVDDELRTGWGNRPATYEVDLGVQHQIGGHASVRRIGYHRWITNQIATVTWRCHRSQFSGPFCVAAPPRHVSESLPAAWWRRVSGLWPLRRPSRRERSRLEPGDVGQQRGTGVTQTNTGLRSTPTCGWRPCGCRVVSTCGTIVRTAAASSPATIPAVLGIGGAPTFDSVDVCRWQPVLRHRNRLPSGREVRRLV